MRASSWWGLVACAFLAAPVWAQDDGGGDDDDFDTNWFGARIGLWYRPAMDMNMKVNGRPRLPGGGQLPQAFGVLIGSSIDIQDDLGVTETVTSDYMFENSILEGEVFFDSEWISLSVWGVAPFAYEGDTVLSRTISFAGQSFTANLPVESRFEQWFLGTDLKVNILNNRIVAISPLVGLRVFALDWEIRGLPPPPLPVIKGDTSDIDSPLKIGDDQLIPYPVLGAEIKVGFRRFIEADLKVAGMYVSYDEVEGGSVQVDAGVTVWLGIPYVGIRLGGRYSTFRFETKDQDEQNSFDFEVEYLGANLSLIARF